jgi:hypothetical protein
MGGGHSKRFECFDKLDVEIQRMILSYLNARDLYSMSLVSRKYAFVLRTPFREWKKSHFKYYSCGYAKYIICRGKIVGYSIYQDENYFWFYRVRGGKRMNNYHYRLDIRNSSLLDMFWQEFRPYEAVHRWKTVVRYNNPHAALLKKVFGVIGPHSNQI